MCRENIRVRSIVDRFLEHSRIFIFGEGPKQQVFASSADWMPRNFERRVEVMFPIESPDLKERIVNEIVPIYLVDNNRARIMQPDGTYLPADFDDEGPHYRSQQMLMDGIIPPTGETMSTTPAPQKPRAAQESNNGKKPARRKPKPGRVAKKDAKSGKQAG